MSSTFLMATFILSLLLWILTIDAIATSGCMEIERNALLTFRAGLVDPLNLLSSWEGEDCCKWRGVVCSNTTGHVMRLNLRSSYDTISYPWKCLCLSGEINPSLLFLTNLEHLDLSMNNFSGTSIPAYLGSLKNLRYLNLSYAHFTGTIPPQIGNLTKLHYLDLRFDFSFSNTLRVDDILWLTRLSSLKYLDMSGVNLNTSIGWLHAVNMLPSLKVLHLFFCSLPGISASLSHFNLTTLNVLDLGENWINSTLPTWLRNLTSITYLDLSSNEFHGVISDEFRNLTSITYLDLNFNEFHGVISDEFRNLTSITYLDLSFNEFHGVISDEFRNLTSITYLALRSNEFHGVISDEFRNLTSITYLDLSANEFHGVISDEFGYLSTLNALLLGDNDFKGMNPRALRHLCNLTTLDLSSIGFGGEIMEWAEKMPRCMRNNLQTLYLGDNNLKGNLSGWLEQMNGLTDINLGSNLLSGSIPTGVWKLPKLISLDLYNNSLEGIVSDVELFYLRKIQYLDLSFNSLTVRVRDDWVPPFQLKWIYLASCHLGPNFPAWLKSQSQLEALDLSRNIIVDTLPSWFSNMSQFLFRLDLSDNQIKGRLPSLMGFTMLSYLNLSSNQFEGPLPSLPYNIFSIDLSNNVFTGVLPNAILPQLYYLSLSNNSIGGSIPPALCESTFLEIFDLSNNNLSGEIPECIGKSNEDLFIMDVSKNNLVGGIPVSVCSPEDVWLLKFNSNGLSGEFPSLQNCTSLIILDLGYNEFSGTIPLWIGESLTLLMVLQLRSNIFSGCIPMLIAQLGYLQVLDLSSNNLSGPLPRSFSNFGWQALKDGRIDRIDNISKVYSVSLSLDVKGEELIFSKILYLVEYIDLSDNNLTGEIPNEIMDLQALQYLNLSRNNLIGHIPEKIGKMQLLESLDLAMNKLSGNIPQSLSVLTFLSHLNLSYNNLSGMIPTGNQLQTLDDPSIYIGNPYLCGPPSMRNCSSIEINYKNNEGPKDKFEWLWIYFSVILGYLSGLAVFCGVLLLNNVWRNAYFSMIDIICDKLCVVTKVTLTRQRQRHRK